MNNYVGETRKRSQTLLIVEGHHERDKLFWLVFKCFPEIKIDIDDVWIYGTNIYLLYEDIVNEYGSEWTTEEIDIDLPFIISKKQTPDSLRYKDDFTNIILVFDYERHDTNFSERKILDMQRKFLDSTDMGKLYLNYPMIESYQHLIALPDVAYSERKVPVSLQPGRKYKELVGKETIIEKVVSFPYRIADLMCDRFEVTNDVIRRKICEDILDISKDGNIDHELQLILQNVVTRRGKETLKYQLIDWIEKVGYAHNGYSYWEYMRKIFMEIIYHNVCKAKRIQKNEYEIKENQYKECFVDLDLVKILEIQNECSRSAATGFIWVLNTCLFLVADYNFALVQWRSECER